MILKMKNNTEWINALLTSTRRYAIPIMTHPGIDLTGQTVKNAVTNGTIHFQAIEALNEKFPADAATIIMDLTVESVDGHKNHYSANPQPPQLAAGKTASTSSTRESSKTLNFCPARIGLPR